jgi:hypothetical protein
MTDVRSTDSDPPDYPASVPGIALVTSWLSASVGSNPGAAGPALANTPDDGGAHGGLHPGGELTSCSVAEVEVVMGDAVDRRNSRRMHIAAAGGDGNGDGMKQPGSVSGPHSAPRVQR